MRRAPFKVQSLKGKVQSKYLLCAFHSKLKDFTQGARNMSSNDQSLILTRRRLLQCAGGLFATAALPAVRAEGADTPQIGQLMTTLSTYMGEAASRPLPAPVVEKTKHMILDTIAAMVSGSELPPGRFAIQFARTYRGNPVSTVVASTVVCGPIEAALANGMLAHSDETDDTHPPSQSHPGCAVVPAAMAVGEQFGIDGTRFLRAVSLGYDVGP